MKILVVIICFCFLCSGDDPPKKHKEKEKNSIEIQQSIVRSLNLKELHALKESYDSVLLKQDTLIKKK